MQCNALTTVRFVCYDNAMAVATKTKSNTEQVAISVTLDQLAHGLRQLSARELETLELLVDRDAMRVIGRSAAQAKAGKLKEL